MQTTNVIQPELLKVATFDTLLAVRALTGIMRLNEHHFINGFSTYMTEAVYTVTPINTATLIDLTAQLEALGYLVEVRGNSDRDRTFNAYKIQDQVCRIAAVFMFAENKLKYYTYCVTPDINQTEELTAVIKPLIKEEPIIVNYVTGFSDKGEVIIDHREVGVDRNRPIDAFYPFIEEGVNGLSEGFLASSSNLLLLVGPRGTGKTTLLREFCRGYKAGDIYQMCGDRVILHPRFDSYLAALPANSLVIIEDADAILGKRTDNNTSLSMLLNELDGLANKGSKFIITTNLENLKSVDSAVLRVGRCYKTVAFRELKAEEANRVADALGYDRVFDTPTSLAEVFHGANQKVTIQPGFRPIGS